MAMEQPLSWKIRSVLAVIVVMILAVPTLAVRAYIASETAKKNIVDRTEPTDERIVTVGGHTTLLEPGSLVREIADWLDIGKEETLDFELGDPLFAPGSAQLSTIGAIRLRQFTEQMKAHSSVTVHIFIPTTVSSAAAWRLERERAVRLREDLENDGVTASRVTIADETDDQPTARTPDLAVLLSK